MKVEDNGNVGDLGWFPPSYTKIRQTVVRGTVVTDLQGTVAPPEGHLMSQPSVSHNNLASIDGQHPDNSNTQQEESDGVATMASSTVSKELNEPANSENQDAAVAHRNEVSSELKEAGLTEDQVIALSPSKEEAALQENAWLMDAIVASKAEAPPLSGGDVVLLRLTQCSSRITQTILSFPEMALAIARMTDAGCDPSLLWACGAILLVPLTEVQVSESGAQLRPHNRFGLAIRSRYDCTRSRTIAQKEAPTAQGRNGDLAREHCRSACCG